MSFVQNFPFFSIIIAMFSGIISSVLPAKAARRLCTAMITAVVIMSGCLLIFTVRTGESFNYMMGHFPAPWGNEIRAGVLEAAMALFFSVIMLFSIISGLGQIKEEIESTKQSLYFVMVNLLLSSLLALIYTNDIFTAYVFVEINTIAACGLIMIRQNGHAIVAAVRYMVMSLIGSGMLLLGIILMYDLTGQLLIEYIRDEVEILAASGQYTVPLTVSIALMGIGLSIKSALFPFSTWVPDAYGYSITPSASILSSLVSKGYIFLLLKIIIRMIGFDVIKDTKITVIFFVYGVLGMIIGSVNAIRETEIRRMVAFSSIAQIGYIYMGFGLGVEAGIIASVFHILSHAATKSLLFISSSALIKVSGDSKKFKDLRGSGRRNVLAGVTFTVGSLSMVGIPLLSGFVSKLLFAEASFRSDMLTMVITLFALAVSTLLNVIYFLRTVITIYMPQDSCPLSGSGVLTKAKNPPVFAAVCVALIALNLFLGMMSEPIVNLIKSGLSMFG